MLLIFFSILGFLNRLDIRAPNFVFFLQTLLQIIIIHGHFQIMNNLVQVLFSLISYIAPIDAGRPRKDDWISCVKMEVNDQKTCFAYPLTAQLYKM